MDESDRLIDSRSDFHEALQNAFEHIVEAGCRQVLLCDDDFSGWPLGHPALLDRLGRWARAHRELHLVARSFDGFHRWHPRWLAWRRHWSHVVHCRAVVDDAESARDAAVPTVTLPSLLIAPGRLGLRLSDPQRHRGRLTTRPGDVQAMRQQFDAISQRSVDAFPVTTLGL